MNLKNKLSRIKEYIDKKNTQNSDEILAPCIGDVIEYEGGHRKVVMSVDIEDDQYSVRFSAGYRRTTDARGRSFNVPIISLNPEKWPPTNVKILRDGYVIYPQFEWKLDLIIWLSNKLLK